MPDISSFDEETRSYFDNMPAFLKESIMQSDAEVYTKEDLVALEQNMLEKS